MTAPPGALHTARGRPVPAKPVTRPVRVDLLPTPVDVKPVYPPLDQVESRFLAVMRFRPKTALTYRDGLRRFHRFLAVVMIDPHSDSIDALPDDVLEYFARWLRDAGYSRATIEVSARSASAFFRFAVRKRLAPPRFIYDLMREGLGEVLGTRPIRSPKIDPRLPLVIAHIDALPLPNISERDGLRRLELLRDRALLHVLFYSGMRRAEVASLNRQDLQDGWAGEALIVGKGDKERNAYFDEETLLHVRAYLVARADLLTPLWLRHDNHRGQPEASGEHWRLSPQSVWLIVKDYARAAGVPATTHHFRHLKASTLLNRGASLSEVQDVLGHASPSTTKAIYAHYTPKFLGDAVRKYSATPAELVAELDAEQSRRRA